jgi:putative endonuclease
VRALIDFAQDAFRAFEEFVGLRKRPDPNNPLRWLGQRDKGHERHQKGWRAEEYAARRLVREGYHLIGRNVYVGVGEIDIVAEHDRRLVFIEVRSRSLNTPVRAASTVDRTKARQILRCARAYMKEHRMRRSEVNPRYDIAEVALDAEGKPCDFSVLQSAITEPPPRRPRR